MELFGVLEPFAQVADAPPHSECYPWKLLGANSRPSGKVANMLIELLHHLLLSKLLEVEEEHYIVREHNDLPCLRLLNQAPCDALSPLVVERGDWIVEHNGRMIVGCAEL